MNREAMILKARRIELGLSQTDVALNSGISIQQYCQEKCSHKIPKI